MTVLVVSNLAKSYGAELVFTGVSFTLGRARKAGLVGPNGSGKSTLLEVIAGRLEPDAGSAQLVGSPRLAYLPQEARPVDGDGLPLLEHALEGLGDLASREERLAELEEALARTSPDDPGLPSLIEDYGRLREAFETGGGYGREARAREVLFGLGFGDRHLDIPVGRLSGGQQTRAHLARLLLGRPDFLLLDEPTNHLDLEAVEWLETYLGTFPGSVLAVSHDRYFLDRVAETILELDRGRLTEWTGNYSAYATQKEQWLAGSREAYDRQAQEIARLEAYVRRYKAGNRTKQAQSREKALVRMNRLERPPGPARRAVIDFRPDRLTGREVLSLNGLGFSFEGPGAEEGGGWLFRGVSALVRRGERVALVGRNGTGKTTLLEVLVGRRQATKGTVTWGAGVEVAYFAQGLDDLDDTKTLLEASMDATGFDIPRARGHLGRFLFSGDDVYRPVRALSGGERSRLVLSCLVAGRPNVLVLDEPTNHLDLPAREALEEAIGRFPGTVVFVSHDRYFVERLATRIWELDAGTLVDAPSDYSEYRLKRAEERARRAGYSPPAPAPERRGPPPAGPALSKNRRARLERELAQIQERVARLDLRRGELEAALTDPSSYRDGAGASLSADYRQVLGSLEEAYAQWERVALELESKD